MDQKPIDIAERFTRLKGHWSPRIIAQLNEYHLKLVKLQGEFVWHSHPDTDEVFIVFYGAMTIHFRDLDVPLATGEMFVIPRGVEHKTSATEECGAMLVELAGTVNTGDTVSEKTAPSDAWIE